MTTTNEAGPDADEAVDLVRLFGVVRSGVSNSDGNDARRTYNAIDGLVAYIDNIESDNATLRGQVAKLDDLLQQQHEGTDAVWNEKHEVMKERDALRAQLAQADSDLKVEIETSKSRKIFADSLIDLLEKTTEARDAAISLSDEWETRCHVLETQRARDAEYITWFESNDVNASMEYHIYKSKKRVDNS